MKGKIEHKLVVALDIGSTYSGYAWQYRDEFETNREPHFNTNWSVGTIQEREYEPRNILVEDHQSQKMTLFDVMKLFIEELKKHCLQNFANKRQKKVDEDKILFVVTVPAIWSESAKAFMKNAAMAAGIGEENVLLAREPEAAAISCMHLTSQQTEDLNNFSDVGQKFLVADLGGGTADLLAVEVNKNGTLEVLHQSHGKDVGGQNINDAFMQLCHDSFQGKKWDETFGLCKYNIDGCFENVKIQIEPSTSENQTIQVDLPKEVTKALHEKTIASQKGSTFDEEEGCFIFEEKFVRKELFQSTCDTIYKSVIKDILIKDETKGITTVILVGGLSESPFVIEILREKVKEDFPGVKVVVPDSPMKSVLLGAVLYGHDSEIIRNRISRETYGVATNVIFDETKHDASKKVRNKETGVFWCTGIFSIHVKKNQSVRLEQLQPRRVYKPMSLGQKSMTLPIYSSSNISPKYITDEGCKKIGKVEIKMPNTTGERDRKVEVRMLYGGTQIAVQANNVTTGEIVEAEIDFE
ncbi:hypothetical protein ACF0H5_017739 [Mactra antiquata]